MFVIDINGTEVCILDDAKTPYSDILRRAADILESEERENHAIDLASRISSALSDRRAVA
jgi:UDP-3-O-acyl-N-acetylglucosamine deacetylase